MSKNKTKIPEGWNQVKLGSLILENNKSKIKVGEAGKNFVFPFFTSGAKVLTYGEFLVDGENIYLSTGGNASVKYFSGRAAYSTDTFSIKSSNDINTRFLYYLFESKIEFINENLFTGSGLKHLQKKGLRELNVLLPPLATQNKIAEILGAVDEEIEKVENIIEESGKLKESQLNKIFCNKNKTVKLGDCVSHVGSGSTPRGGERVYLREGVLFIRSQNVYFDGLRTDDIFYISHDTHQQMKRSKVLPNDILLNITGASIGRACIVPKNFTEANVNQHVCIIRTRELITPEFLLYFLQSKIGQNQIMSLQAGGNRQGLNFQQIRSFKITLLPLEEQKINIDILSTIDNKILVYKKIKNNLIQLKKGLMADLLSGEVNV